MFLGVEFFGWGWWMICENALLLICHYASKSLGKCCLRLVDVYRVEILADEDVIR